MEADQQVTDLSWLAMTPVNQGFEWFILHNFWAAVALAVFGLVLLIASRGIVQPPFSQRFPKVTWLLDLVALPTLTFVIGSIAERIFLFFDLLLPGYSVDLATGALFYFVLAWLAGRGIELFFWRGYVEKRTGYAVPILLRGLSYALLLFMALVFILWRSGYSPTGVLISTGVIAAVVALALQSTLSDLFSGIALSLEQSYGIGDWIELEDGTLGEVIDVSWRSTTLKSFNNSELILPNSQLARSRIHNYHRPEMTYAQWFPVLLPPEIEPTTAKRMLTDAVMRCRHVLTHPPPAIRLTDAGTVPYKYMVYVYFRDYMAMYPGRDALFREIDAELRRQNIRPGATSQEFYLSRRGDMQMQPTNVASALRGVDLFAVLDHDQIDDLASRATFEVVDADTKVMEQGMHVDAIYILWSGLLASHYLSPDKVLIDVEDLKPGDSFGQISVVTNEPALVTVTSSTESILIRIDPDAIRPLIEASPDLGQRFAKVVADRMQSITRAQAARSASRLKTLPTNVAEIRQRLEMVFFGDKPNRRSR